MKNILSIILILILTESVFADTFSVGGKQLDIPSPQGFLRVTEKMDAVYRLSLQMVDPMNDQLAYYIAESDAPVAMAGEMPPLERYFILKVNKRIKNIVIGSKDFAKLKSITKKQNKEIFRSAESEISGLMDKTSEGISKEFDINFAWQVSKVMPLDPHHETDNSFAFSAYYNNRTVVEGGKKDFIVSGTTTFLNVAGKVIFLYCYGPQKELKWTRNASKAWADMIMANNDQPPSRSSDSLGMDWNKVIEEGMLGAIGGGLFVFIFVVFLMLKKKKGK